MNCKACGVNIDHEHGKRLYCSTCHPPKGEKADLQREIAALRARLAAAERDLSDSSAQLIADEGEIQRLRADLARAREAAFLEAEEMIRRHGDSFTARGDNGWYHAFGRAADVVHSMIAAAPPAPVPCPACARKDEQLAEARALLEKYKPDTIPCHQNTNGEWVPDAEHPIDAFLREIAAPPAPAAEATPKKYFLLAAMYGLGDLPLWWRPGGHGYTIHLETAGAYTAEEIHQYRLRKNIESGQIIAIPVDEAWQHAWHYIPAEASDPRRGEFCRCKFLERFQGVMPDDL